METVESVTLFFREGTSDKQYRVELLADDRRPEGYAPPRAGPARKLRYSRGWGVRCFYGRRGTAFTQVTKLQDAGEGAARVQFCRALTEKTAKGYKVEFVTMRGPSINATLNYTAPSTRLNDVAREVVRSSTATTPRQAPGWQLAGPRGRGVRPEIAERLLRTQQQIQADRERVAAERKQKPPQPPAVDPFAPVKRKIRLEEKER